MPGIFGFRALVLNGMLTREQIQATYEQGPEAIVALVLAQEDTVAALRATVATQHDTIAVLSARVKRYPPKVCK